MNDTFLSDLKQALDNCISSTDSIHWMICNNPESDFSRGQNISVLPVHPSHAHGHTRCIGF